MNDDTKAALERARAHAMRWLDGLATRRVGPAADFAAIHAALDTPFPEAGADAAAVIDALAAGAEPGLVASTGPRYFGFVNGGSVPAALAANWLVDAWDQNGALNVMSPGTAAVEAVAARWFKEAVGLPESASVGFTTGCTMANATGIAAGRHALLARAGWDVEADGLFGAPKLDVVVGEEVHSSVAGTLQLLGLGRERVIRVPADGQGRMKADALRGVLAAATNPTLLCAQVGNVNTGACDPMAAIADACAAARVETWLHVDGAFGLWAAAAPALRHLVAGVERADSWATDAHKWLNVPYDGGIVAVRDEAAHRAPMTQSGAYLIRAGAAPDGMEYVPDASRRVRGVAVYAALRSLGRDGLAALIEGNCARARQFAERMMGEDGIAVLNEVALNQVLVRFGGDSEAGDKLTNEVIAAVQADGTAWFGGTVWQGKGAMRVSVSNWRTGEADIDRAAEAVIGCYRRLR